MGLMKETKQSGHCSVLSDKTWNRVQLHFLLSQRKSIRNLCYPTEFNYEKYSAWLLLVLIPCLKWCEAWIHLGVYDLSQMLEYGAVAIHEMCHCTWEKIRYNMPFCATMWLAPFCLGILSALNVPRNLLWRIYNCWMKLNEIAACSKT
jgi:hypothetical protein